MKLDLLSTRELVLELQKREGVASIVVDPHEMEITTTEGPAIILVIED